MDMFSYGGMTQQPFNGGGGETAQLRGRIAELEREVERLFLLSEAVWTLMKIEHNFTDQVLEKAVEGIDALDGTVDGRKTKSPTRDCPGCGRKLIGKGRSVCLWCGANVGLAPFER